MAVFGSRWNGLYPSSTTKQLCITGTNHQMTTAIVARKYFAVLKRHICLVGSNGRLIPIFQGHNYLSDEDQFVDLNGDGVPEILSVHGVGGTSPDNPSKFVTTSTSIVIIPVSHHQQPLLHVLFGKRNLREPPAWHWNLRILEDGRSVITLSSPTSTAPIAEFEWQAAIGAFSCPQGSPSEGFIARAGSIPSQLIEEFVLPDLGGNQET